MYLSPSLKTGPLRTEPGVLCVQKHTLPTLLKPVPFTHGTGWPGPGKQKEGKADVYPKVTAGLGEVQGGGVAGFPFGEGSLGCSTKEGLKRTRISAGDSVDGRRDLDHHHNLPKLSNLHNYPSQHASSVLT